jgi:anti-sigma regulatory factor (Ser/Thr protein kinase)
MCGGQENCLFLLDPEPGADRLAREHLRPWLVEQGLIEDEIHDVLTAVTEAIDSVVTTEHDRDRAEPVQVSAVIDRDERGARGLALRVVDQGTMPISRGAVSDEVDYGSLMMRSAMDDVTTRRDPQGGTVIAMRTRPLLRRPRAHSAVR